MKTAPSPRENTSKALVVAIVCSALIAFWTQHSELVIDSPSFNSIHPSVAGFFAMICVALFANPLLGRIRRRWMLTQREMLLVYAIMIVVGPIVSIGGVHFLLPTPIVPYYYATPENEYAELFHSHIPRWFGPKDPEAIRNFYEGSEGAGVPWDVWLVPVILWSLFLLVVYFVFFCMNVLIRRQWIDREKLTFPLVHLPLAMTAEPHGAGVYADFFKNGRMWLGFLIPVIIHGVNGTNVYFPTFPTITYRYINLSPFFADPPWNKVGSFTISLYPCVIGFSYILALDLSFSVGFFYLLQKAQMVLGAAIGWTGKSGSSLSQFPFIEEQGAGAFLTIALTSLIMARRHLADVLKKTFLRAEHVKDADEPLPYAWAVAGYFGGILLLAGWSVAAGMSPGFALVFFLFFSLYALSLTRMRVQAGLGAIHGPMKIQELMVIAFGTPMLGARNLTILAHYYFMTGEMRGVMSVMPSQLEGIRLAESVGIRPRRLLLGVLFGSVVGLALAQFAALRTIYAYSANILNDFRVRSLPQTPFRELRALLISSRDVEWGSLLFVGVGSAITLFLTFMRLKFLWWAFHPVGYAAAYTGRTIHWVWFPMLLGCLLKYVALRHGGLRTYRKTLPFFLGLILGDFFMGGLWGVIGLSSSQPGYLFFP